MSKTIYHDTTGKRRVKADELRSKLEELESAYDEVTRTAQVEILQAKDNLKKAEMETLQVSFFLDYYFNFNLL